MKQTIITAVILMYSVLSFAQIDSNYSSESNYKVNKFGKLIANIQPNMTGGFDSYGRTINTKLDSAYLYSFSRTYKSYYTYDVNGILVGKKSKALDTFRDYDSSITEYIYIIHMV